MNAVKAFTRPSRVGEPGKPSPPRVPGRLTYTEELACRQLFRAGWPVEDLARLYGVEVSVIRRVLGRCR